MFDNSLDNKPIFVKTNGNLIKDLTMSMLNLTSRFSGMATKIFKVSKDFVMRPDLITSAIFGNDTKTEFVLKYNGISNPFAIDVDDIIIVPEIDTLQQMAKTATSINDASDKIKNSYKYIDPTKNPKTSSEISNFESRSLINVNTGALPPNISDTGVSPVTFKNGRVYFGNGAESCLQNGASSSEYLTNVIKNKVQ
jgi:hypothetical protein